MTILKSFKVPASAEGLKLTEAGKLFIAFIASKDPETQQPWCPDVRAALPYITEAFTPESAPDLALVEVGERPAWRDPKNVYHTKWKVTNIPTLARFELVNGKVSETGRLVEGEILSEKRLKSFISSD